MNLPGIKVDPIITLAGEHEVNQVFFDEVRVPKAGRLGAENDGWTVAKYLLEFERGGGSSAGLEAAVARIRKLANKSGLMTTCPAFPGKLAAAEISLEAIKITEQRVSSALSRGGNPGPAASMLKVQRTEMMQRIDALGIEAGGSYACVEQMEARQPGSNVDPVGPGDLLTLMPRYLNNRAGSIYGGSNEVQRNIMAKLVLGL